MCETRDLGIKWPCWHTLVFRNEITIDMRYVCPKDDQCVGEVGSKHEQAELKERAWIEPAPVLLRKKVKGA